MDIFSPRGMKFSRLKPYDLTKADLAELYAVSERTINRWVAREGLPHSSFGKYTLRFNEEEVGKWIEEQKAKWAAEKERMYPGGKRVQKLAPPALGGGGGGA